ncbi:MAG: type II toxin-antitoxin system VapC family toxin [Chloroflexi bacterium]|jgi:predicted nucleic acid-binding protein|nr:type II toxin-antitoxin system VapC family toxin [Chloroflexota bacterium]
MILLDTTVLVYALGADHPLQAPCRRLIEAVTEGRIEASTTPEVVQEFVHVRARRHGREDASRQGRDYAALLAPLLPIGESSLLLGLRLFEEHPELGAFDAVLAATAIANVVDALVSADRAFGHVRGLPYVDPSTSGMARLLL